MYRLGAVFLLVAACSDYGLSSEPKPADPPPEETTPPPPPPPPVPEPEPEPEPEPSCDDFEPPLWVWVASEPFLGADDPVDGAGLPFWDPTADLSSFAPVVLPDLGIPVGWDRAYVATFDLAEIPFNLSLNLQSDDGIWVWVNGTLAGHWGGEWQQEGCVNENANCLVTSAVDPVDVTGLLVVGTNTLATRVSNPILNAYFEILPECVAP